jgi:phospholipase C
VKPASNYDGHPGYSTLASFEAFSSQVISDVARNPKLWAHTAIFVTMDEGGGYYDSGYVQPLTFFGDGPRIPMIVVSPFTRPGQIDHTYTDHVSILKFIEANWHLPPLSARSWDNLPDPVAPASDPYVPHNRPAIGDLMTLFDFHRSGAAIAASGRALVRAVAPAAARMHGPRPALAHREVSATRR